MGMFCYNYCPAFYTIGTGKHSSTATEICVTNCYNSFYPYFKYEGTNTHCIASCEEKEYY